VWGSSTGGTIARASSDDTIVWGSSTLNTILAKAPF
jgi:hypothetical protein